MHVGSLIVVVCSLRRVQHFMLCHATGVISNVNLRSLEYCKEQFTASRPFHSRCYMRSTQQLCEMSLLNDKVAANTTKTLLQINLGKL